MTEEVSGRQYDIVVFGATGYTGKYVNEELHRIQSEGRRVLSWAAAGRNQSKVEAFLAESGIEGVDVMVADVYDQTSLEEMCSKATVLINCVGPYQLFGEQVVKACVAQKTNYVDITGETFFMEKMAAGYDEAARDAGVYIVSACGFDSIPNDLGALLLQRTFNGELVYVDSFMSVSSGGKSPSGFNIGTWESFLRSINNHSKLKTFRRQQDQPRLPLPSTKGPSHAPLFYSQLANRWCLPFPGPDKAIVYRSSRYRKDHEGVEPFNFRTYYGTDSMLQAVGVVAFFLFLLPLVMTKIGLRLLLKFPSFFSFGMASNTGPSRESLEDTTFTVALHGIGYAEEDDRTQAPKSKITVKVRGIDPGYGATSALLVQSALCFIDEKDNLPPTGGVYTPAVAFGNTKIIQNLENTGKVKFEVQPN